MMYRKDWNADLSGQRGHCIREGGIILLSADDERPLSVVKRASEGREFCWVVPAKWLVSGRDVVLPATFDAPEVLFSLLWQQRLPEREVEMHRTGGIFERPPHGPARNRFGVSEGDARVVRDLDVYGPHDVASVQADLINRLVGADVPRVGRAVSREKQQRDSGKERFYSGWREVYGGGS